MAAHSPCPYTDCGSSDAFSWDERGFGKCHACEKSYPMKGMPEVFPWVKETYQLKERVRPMDIPVKSVTYEGIRGIDPDVAKLYRIQKQLGEDGQAVRFAFGYPDKTKYRACAEKKFWIKEGGTITDFFGPEFNSGTSKKLYITEGEFDAASLYQILGKTYPVVSLPTASWGDSFLTANGKKNLKYLQSFEQIIYAGELDDAGRRSADKLYEIFPEKMYYVPMSQYKDANEFLENGASNDLKWAALKPQRYSPENFYVSSDAFTDILRNETPYEFTPTPCQELNEAIQGHTKGGMTLYKAYPGSGKTTLFRYFQYDLLKNTDKKIAVLHLEESKSTTLRGLASYELGKNVNTKIAARDAGVTEDQVIQAVQSFTNNDNLVLFEFRQNDYSRIFEAALDYIRIAVTVYGVEYVFLDHIQRLAYMAGVEDATRNLTTFAVRVEDMCRDLNFGFNAISHINDMGAAKYAKSLEESCIIAVDITRDKENEDEIIQNTVQLSIPGKNRPWSKLGPCGSLFYDRDTGLLREEV